MSERRACKVLEQPRSTQRHEPLVKDDGQALTNDIVGLATRFGRYGYRRITALLRHAGWDVNHKRVERIWRREGLKVPVRQPRRGRLWLNDGSTIRLRPERSNHVWAYDFVHIRTRDGRTVRLLTVIDEYTRECLAIRAGRSIRSSDVIETLAGLMADKGVPEHIRSDNGPEFMARAIREWLRGVGAGTLCIEPGSPWENGYVESFNGKLRDELLDREVFYTLLEVQVLTEQYRQTYNRIRPQSSLGYRPPTPETIQPPDLVPEGNGGANIEGGTTIGGRSSPHLLPAQSLGGATADVIAQHHRLDQVGPVDVFPFPYGQGGRQDGAAGVDAGGAVGIVGLIGMGHHSVGDGGVHRRRHHRTANHLGFFGSALLRNVLPGQNSRLKNRT